MLGLGGGDEQHPRDVVLVAREQEVRLALNGQTRRVKLVVGARTGGVQDRRLGADDLVVADDERRDGGLAEHVAAVLRGAGEAVDEILVHHGLLGRDLLCAHSITTSGWGANPTFV